MSAEYGLRALLASEPTQPTPHTVDARDSRERWEYALEGDWLVQVVNEHTCGTGPDGYYGAHEPGCGTIPVANIADLLAAARAEAWDEGYSAGFLDAGTITTGWRGGTPNPYRQEAAR